MSATNGSDNASRSTAPISEKPEWQKRRDTHGAEFPDNLKNWLSLDPVWRARIDDVVEAFGSFGEAGGVANKESFDAVEALTLEEVDANWTVDDPVVRRDLPLDTEWLLVFRDEDQLTLMTLTPDGYFARIFWETSFAGKPEAILLGWKPPKTQSKKLPNLNN